MLALALVTPVPMTDGMRLPQGGGDDDEESLLFSDLGTLNGGDGDSKVSASVVNDDHAHVGDVDDPDRVPPGDNDDGNVRAPAATDPFVVAAGVTVGRIADQSQDQARTRAPDPAGSTKKLCTSVWRDEIGKVRECDRAHQPRCGDPRCFPVRRGDCQHWHRLGNAQQQRQQQQQGNGRSAGPGRAGRPQAQGKFLRNRGQRQQQQHHQTVLQEGQRQQGQPQPQGQQQRGRQQQQQPNHSHRRASKFNGNSHSRDNGGSSSGGSNLPLLDRLAAVERRMGLAAMIPQQQQPQLLQPSYSDVARGRFGSGPARGPVPLVGNGSSNSSNTNVPVASVPAQPDPAMLSTVVSAVLVVLSKGMQHF